MTDLYVWHDLFVPVAWVLRMCGMTDLYVLQGWFERGMPYLHGRCDSGVQWLILQWLVLYFMTHSVFHETFWVPLLILMWTMTHLYYRLCHMPHSTFLARFKGGHSVLQCVAVCCSVLQCVAVCCSVLQCVAVCCSTCLACSSAWHDSFIRCAWHASGVCCASNDSFVCCAWHDADVCCAWHDSFVCCAWHDSCIYGKWSLSRVALLCITPSYVWHDSNPYILDGALTWAALLC